MVLFHWRILLTGQFSLLTEWEGVNQAYVWYHFWADSIRSGIVPLWDPYTYFGHTFIGEMQTGTFYPLNLLWLLFPTNDLGVCSAATYHYLFAFARLIGVVNMYLLVRWLGCSRYAALVAGLAFSFGGFVSKMGWPHMLHSAIWLPLIFLFLLKALQARLWPNAAAYGAAAGLLLGLATLAGGLHVVMMQAIIVATAAPFLVPGDPEARFARWRHAALVVAIIGAFAFSTSAIQLLPSAEYSSQSMRWLGDASISPMEKIPYAEMSHGIYPEGLVALLFPYAFHGNTGSGEVVNPYMSVMVLVLAAIGVWRTWSQPLVKYLLALGIVALLYALGGFSPIHGMLYSIVPKLWLAREAGRFVYLSSFAIAVLAAFGTDALFSRQGYLDWSGVYPILRRVAVAALAVLIVPAAYPTLVQISPHTAFSMLIILGTVATVVFVRKQGAGTAAKVVMLALILFDLNYFDWLPRNKIELARSSTNQLERLRSMENTARFLKTLPGEFRIHVDTADPPNIGDLYQIAATRGTAVTLHNHYQRMLGHFDLMNVRYLIRPASASEPGPVYEDLNWKVYERPSAFPRAWLVHQVQRVSSEDEEFARLGELNLREVAVTQERIDGIFESPKSPVASAGSVQFTRYSPLDVEFSVTSGGRALLVVSDMFYGGWQATVNGKLETIHRVNGALRGIVVNGGHSTVRMRYAPRSVTIGFVFLLLAITGCAAVFVLLLRQTRREQLVRNSRGGRIFSLVDDLSTNYVSAQGARPKSEDMIGQPGPENTETPVPDRMTES